MIVKQRDKPLYLMQLQSLERRLSLKHPKKKEVTLARVNKSTGLNGEKQIDFPLSFLDSTTYQILHQLRLQDDQGYFQIDSLILSSNFALILEIKNWFGQILLNSNGQVIRINEEGQEEGFPNPIQQVKLQQYRLRKWLHKHHCSNLPIVFFVVIANPKTIIKRASKEESVPKTVIHSSQLFFEIRKLEDRFNDRHISDEELHTIVRMLKQSHVPKEENILEKFQIDQEELLRGVSCPKCQTIGMGRVYTKWLCGYCEHQSKGAHIEAINDYVLLVDDKATNSQLREFLLVDSPNVMKYLLQKESYTFSGNTKARYYHLTLKNRPNF